MGSASLKRQKPRDYIACFEGIMIGADRVKLIDSGYLVDRYYIVWF